MTASMLRHTITLVLNFSDNNTTHYDIYWYAISDSSHNGDQKMIEQKWLNREIESIGLTLSISSDH